MKHAEYVMLELVVPCEGRTDDETGNIFGGVLYG